MPGDNPETERTVIVEKAHLLHDQLEYSAENAENPENEVDAAYQNRRVELCEQYIDELEGDGLSESVVHGRFTEAQEKVNATEDETPETIVSYAEFDATKQVIREYFGGFEHDPVNLGDVMSSSLREGGLVVLNGTEGTAAFTISDEGMAMATADTILADTDVNVHEAAQTPGSVV